MDIVYRRLRSCFQDKFLSLVIVAGYLALMCQFHRYLRPDQLFLILALAAVAVLGKTGGKRFIIDWAPFTIFIILYDGMRGIADTIGYSVNVRGPYMLEERLFGWLTGGHPLPFILQWWRMSLDGSWIVDWLNSVSGMFYTAHFLVPFVFGWIIWHTYRDRKGFYVFAYSLTILNFLALITFILYPAAPPWYVWKYHFAVPNVAAFHFGDPSVLVDVDKLLRFPLFNSIYGALNPNAFAAIPSLHAAYPALIAFFAFSRWKNIFVRILLVVYVASTWFAACWLNHHYIVDLIIGAIYTAASIYLCNRWLMPYVIEPILFRRPGSESNFSGEEGRSGIRFGTLLFGTCGMILIVLLLAHANGKI